MFFMVELYARKSLEKILLRPGVGCACRVLAIYKYWRSNNFTSEEVRDIVAGQYFDKSIDEIHGSGYVVQSLEAARWCFYTYG
jgi:hypothetical protein